MSKDAYEKAKTKSGTRLTVGAFYQLGKAVTLGALQQYLSHILLFLAGTGFCRTSLGV
jgi:hypothetical protein